MAKPRSAANIISSDRKKKQLSPAMFAWAKANRKLQSPTKAQKKIFAQYDSMVKGGKPKQSEELKIENKSTEAKPPKDKPKNSSSSNLTTGTNKTSPTNTRLNRQPGSTGGRGGSGGMPSNPPSPTVTKKGSNTGAAVDPRERALRRNLKEVNSNRSSKGRKNIQLMVNQQSGSSKRNQKQVEDRRRRAREQGAKRNRNSMFARRYMDS